MRIEGLIDNLYEASRQLFIPVTRHFILTNGGVQVVSNLEPVSTKGEQPGF